MDDDNDKFQPGRINSLLYSLFYDAFTEMYQHIRIGMKQPCPDLLKLTLQAETHGVEYRDYYSEYIRNKQDINRRYGGGTDISVREHYERLQNVTKLMNNIGSFRLRERNPYPQSEEEDEYFITCFDYDVSDVDPEIPLVKSLIEFYYGELAREFEKKTDHARRKAATLRGKRAYVFYTKYKEYEASGFENRRIEEIFGMTDEERDILEYWITELLPHGISTTVFAKAGMGKSNFSTFIIQCILILKPKWDVITTIPLIFSHMMNGEEMFPDYQIDRVKFVSNMSELLMVSSDIVLNDRIPAVIIDEFDSALTTTEMRSKAGANLRDYVYLERHYDVQGPLFIYHVRRDIPVPMRNQTISADVFMITNYVNRRTRHISRVVSNPTRWQSGWRGGGRYLPIPLTNLPYYNQGTSPFTVMDVDVQWLNAHVRGVKKDAARQIKQLVPLRGWDKEYQKQLEKERERERRPTIEPRGVRNEPKKDDKNESKKNEPTDEDKK